MQRSPVHHRVERDTKLPWPHPYPSSNFQPPHLHLAALSSCPGRAHSEEEGNTFLDHFLFFVWGSARRGQLSKRRGQRKKTERNSHQLLERRLSWTCWEYWGLGRLLCFASCHLSITPHMSCPKISAPLYF